MDTSEEINDETDHDEDSPRGYFTRAKRRKLEERYEGREDASTSRLYRIPEIGRRKNPIMHVPTEVLCCIFRHISYHELSSKVRLVNRRFKSVAEHLLNVGFKKINKTMKCMIKSTTDSLNYSTDDMEIKCITKMLCFLEILSCQYALIFVTIWRYVYNEYYRTNRTCMYGGMIIDVHDQFIRKFTSCPNELYAPAILKDYSLPQEVTKITQLTKTFCVHFDKFNEESSQNCLVHSGCKILDILDCATYAQKNVQLELKTEDYFSARVSGWLPSLREYIRRERNGHSDMNTEYPFSYSFYFKNSWFIQMPIPQAKEMDWSQKQRLMHMRLRRYATEYHANEIVYAHNDMYLQQEQYEREVALRPNAHIPVKKPGNNVYTGYGDVEDTFFYYGVMNDGAYIQKFHLDEDNDEEDDEEELNQVQEPNLDINRENSEEDILYGLPYNGFRVDITVKCPLSYSPYKYLERLPDVERKTLKNKPATKGTTYIEMHFDCFGAHYPRLPSRYSYQFQSKRS